MLAWEHVVIAFPRLLGAVETVTVLVKYPNKSRKQLRVQEHQAWAQKDPLVLGPNGSSQCLEDSVQKGDLTDLFLIGKKRFSSLEISELANSG